MNSSDTTNNKGLIQLSKESASHAHPFNFKQITQIALGLAVGIGGWNLAQKSEKVRSVFNFPAELLTNAIHKATGMPKDAVSLGVREVYDVFLFGPLIAVAAMLTNKMMDKGGGQTPG